MVTMFAKTLAQTFARTFAGTSACAGLVVAGLLAGAAGCGLGQSPAGHSSSAAVPSASPATTPMTATPSRTAAKPVTAAVPAGFAATSVTFVSATEAFVLGTAPCPAAPCTLVAHTRDRGVSWHGLTGPGAPIGRLGARSAVWGIRFAAPRHGFVFGTSLWETTDGARWARPAQPGGSILALEIVDGQVLAITARCTLASGCARPASLKRRPLLGGHWSTLASAHDPAGPIATQGAVAAVLDGDNVLVTSDGGLSLRTQRTPCDGTGYFHASSVAVSSVHGLALLCTGQGYTGHTDKRVYRSADGGAHWQRAADPGSTGDGGMLAAATPSAMVIATASAASWLYHSGDGAARWQTVRFVGDGGIGWADLGFTTTADGVVVYGPADGDGHGNDRPGQLLLTGDGGRTWRLVHW
jgi:hypothetical protein